MKSGVLVYTLIFVLFLTGFGLGILGLHQFISNKITVNTYFLGQDVSFKNIQNIKSEFSQIFWNNIPTKLNLIIDNSFYSINTKDIIQDVIIYKNDILSRTFKTNLDISSRKEIKPIIQYDYTKILNLFDFKIKGYYNNTNQEYIKIENGILKNCHTKTIRASINFEKLKYLLDSHILNNTQLQPTIQFFIQDILLDPNDARFIYDCEEYFKYYDTLKNTIEKIYQNIPFDEIFGIAYINSKPKWTIIDENKLIQYLKVNYEEKINTNVIEGEYEIVNNKIYLYKPYKEGKIFRIDMTLDKIKTWLHSNRNENIEPVIEILPPKVTRMNLEILDFTKKIGEGKTRLHKIINNSNNEIFFAEQGMYEIDKTVVYPNQIFSYIDAINPQNGITKHGRLIGSGICNATTTLFRAVLESGLPVIERHYHARNYPSYAWGYPLNIVDAAYLTSPRVDLRFQNDLKYPILFKIEITQDNEYQYHTIKVYTSSKAPDRKVELLNWRKFNVYSDTVFSGSFDRKVYENGILIREETFYSKYN
ncbi:MAG: VanW family protein [Candidatus Dojkabacteria bacterium]|nr:VanW family protein [Candidatus Dojkabacteria bacterium]